MRCFKCKSDTIVKDSRPKDGSIRRRRRCLKCGNRFSTIEVLVMERVKKPALPKHAPIRKKRIRITTNIAKPKFEDLDFDKMSDAEIEAAMEDYR